MEKKSCVVSAVVCCAAYIFSKARAWPNLKYMLVETCPFTHQAYIALTCNKGGRFRARYVLKAHAAELIQKLNSSLSAVKRHSPVSCWHGLFPVGGTRPPHSLEYLADLGQRHGRGAKLGWRKQTGAV